jgi:hypothetical protein
VAALRHVISLEILFLYKSCRFGKAAPGACHTFVQEVSRVIAIGLTNSLGGEIQVHITFPEELDRICVSIFNHASTPFQCNADGIDIIDVSRRKMFIFVEFEFIILSDPHTCGAFQAFLDCPP